jgi:signal transduction histidine kinase/ligand-binding sensor domain-containing protein/DNA-binding response OmpR family regulator
MPPKAFITVCLLTWLYLPVSAQKHEVHFTSLTSKDGLLSNAVNAILKDSLGLMWFATDDGLNKFDGTNFTVYSHHAGDSTSLRANEVLALHQDRSGNLWIGTSGGGLSLYNRKTDNFTNFPHTSIGGFSKNGVIKSICSDYLGKIWMTQYDGLFVLDPLSKNIQELNLNTNSGIHGKVTLICVFEDSQHRMWVGTDYGLFLYKRESNAFQRFIHNESDMYSLSSDRIKAIAEDRYGQIWVGTANGLNRIVPNRSGFLIYRYTGAHAGVLNSDEISCIAADPEGPLWVGTSEGLKKLDPQKDEIAVYVPEIRNNHSLTSKNIKCAYIDNQGIYWFGTLWGGINKYDRNLNLFNLKLSNAFQKYGNSAAIVSALAENRNGRLFVGTDGGGVYEFDRKTDQMRYIDIPGKEKTNKPLAVLALTLTRNNELFVGTYGKGLFICNQAAGNVEHLQKGLGLTNLNSNDIFCLKEDRKGAVWIGTNGDGLNVMVNKKVVAKYTRSPAASNEFLLPVNGYIRAIEEDREGNIWIGSHGAGLAIYNPGTRKWTVFTQDNSQLPSDKVQALLCDSHGRMWIGTYGSGLSLFDKTKNQFINFAEKEGLPNPTIYQIVEDLQGRIWLSTNTGISSFDINTKSFRNFNSQNGVQHNNFAHGSGLRLADGALVFGGLQGFNFFDPGKLTVNSNVPTVIFTDLKISNKSVFAGNDSPIKEHISIAQEIRLAYKQNFALSFVALNYTTSKQNHYAYKLEGFDKDWNYSGTMNTASYTNLDPGEYVFHVKAGNNDGIWSSKNTMIKIYVRPPFWRTTYAYIFYFLAIGGLLLYSRYKGINRLQKKFALEQERQEVKRMQELDRLKLKFLTNLSHDFRTPIALITGPVDQLITEEGVKGKLDKLNMIRRNARRLLNLVNQLLDFRKMEEHELRLQLSKGEIVSFVKEVSESFRDLSERKHINFVFKSSIERMDVLFDHDKIERILFNLLSNAFKFTLEGGTIRVEMDRANIHDPENNWLSIQVCDTGIGIPKDKHEKIFEHFFQNNSPSAILNQGTGIGLSITREFIKMHGGMIGVESEPGKGCTFTMQLPLKAVLEKVDEQADPVSSETVPVHDYPPQPALPCPAGNGNENMPEAISILLVEDNEDFRFYLKDNLRNNYKVLEAVNGKEGWQKALASHPHLIVSDISMPEMDGIHLVKKLKADKRTSHIPVILLTAMTNEEQQIKGLGTGAIDYITKPFNFEVLNAKIKSLLELKSAMQCAYTKQIKVASPEVEIESADEKLLQEIVSFLEKNITNSQLSVEVLSKQAGMSRSSFYTKLLQLTGQTPVEYIRCFRLEKASVLLQKSNMTIAEIAYQVGFTTPKYFAKAFKDRFNMLPSEFIAEKRKAKQQTIDNRQ